MAVITNNFEGGTDGVAITAANSGGASGTPFNAIWGTGFNYSASDATQGVMGAGVAGSAYGAGQWSLATPTQIAIQMYFKPKAIPTSGDCYLMRLHKSGTRLFDVHVQGTGHLRIFDASGATVWTATNALVANTYYRLEAFVVAGATSSTGTIKVGYYLGNSTTPVETVYLNTAANVGTATNFDILLVGKYNNAPEAYGFDKFSYDPAATDFIGVSTNAPPTVSTPANQNVSAGASVSESVTASSTSGTISSYAWSFTYPTSGAPTLTGASTANASFTAGAAGSLYVLQCVVTDSNALTTTVTTEVRVPTSGDATILSGAAAVTVGSWSNVGGAATGGDALADSSDTTYLESSSLSATSQSIRHRLAPMAARSALNLTVRLAQDTTGADTVTIRLYEGTTLRQSWTPTITTSFTDYVLSLTTPGAITDWGNLYLEAAATSP